MPIAEMYVKVVLAALVLGVATGCSAGKLVYRIPPPGEGAAYKAVVVSDFDLIRDGWVPYDSGTTIADMVAAELSRSGNFEYVERVRVPDGADAAAGTLLIRGTVLHYDPGCKFCEWLIRVNDKGKSSVTVRAVFVDVATGRVVADAEIEGRAKKPGWGKSRYVRVVDRIVSIVDDITAADGRSARR